MAQMVDMEDSSMDVEKIRCPCGVNEVVYGVLANYTSGAVLA